MTRYIDGTGKVHMLDSYPVYDPRGAVFNIARARAIELREIGQEVGELIVWTALSYFAKSKPTDTPPHMEDGKADALLQDIIREAAGNGGRHE